MASQGTMIVNISGTRSVVVVARFHGLGGQNGVEVVAVGLFVDPSTDGSEHVAVDFDMFVT